MKPKLCYFADGWRKNDEAQKEILSRADLLISNCWTPDIVADLRRRNPSVRLLWDLEVPFVRLHLWDETAVDWSIDEAVARAAFKNDWFLRNTRKEKIEMPGGRLLLNWTEFCPKDEHGRRAAEWYAEELKRIAVHRAFWPAWNWNNPHTINGIYFSRMAGSLSSQDPTRRLVLADPDRNGKPEGVTAADDGFDKLTIFMRPETNHFHEALYRDLGAWFVALIRNRTDGPSWQYDMNGAVYEDDPTVPGSHEDLVQYLEADTIYGWHRPNGLHGSPMSVVVVRPDLTGSSEVNRKRMIRGLALTLLYDGYFCWQGGSVFPLWDPIMGIDLGVPTTPCISRPIGANGLIWERLYTRAQVRVNASPFPVDGLGPGEGEIAQ